MGEVPRLRRLDAVLGHDVRPPPQVDQTLSGREPRLASLLEDSRS